MIGIVVENNALNFGSGMGSCVASVAFWLDPENNDLTLEQKQAVLDKLARGDLPEGQSLATGLLKAWGPIVVPVLLPATAMAGSVIAAAANGNTVYYS